MNLYLLGLIIFYFLGFFMAGLLAAQKREEELKELAERIERTRQKWITLTDTKGQDKWELYQMEDEKDE